MIKKNLTLITLVSAIFISFSAKADWPVAVTDRVAFHPSYGDFFKIDVLLNDIGKGLKIKEFNDWSENGARVTSNNPERLLYRYRQPTDFVGEDGFWYVIEDEQGRTNAARVIVDVKSADLPLPYPEDDNIDVPRDTSIRINVLENDLFTKYIPLEVTETGTRVTVNRGGFINTFNEWSEKGGRIEKVLAYEFEDYLGRDDKEYHLKYTPPPGFVGVDTFWYTIKDKDFKLAGTNADAAKVTVNVLPDNNITTPYPVANPDQRIFICGQRGCGRTTSISVLRNDVGQNLLIKLNSAWSLKGGEVDLLRIDPKFQPSVKYRAGSIDLSEPNFKDTVWYIIEDQFGRQNWSAIDISSRPQF